MRAKPASLTVEQMQEADRKAVKDYGLPSVVLMENAGRAVAQEILNRRESLKASGSLSVALVCGGGNNGGDGFVAARHLANQDVAVTVYHTQHPDDMSPDAALNFRVLEKMRVPRVAWKEAPKDAFSRHDVVVDALLGTGTKGQIRGEARDVIERINGSHRPVLAVDIPSGLDADRGQALGKCVRATWTVTLGASKVGLEALGAETFVGELIVADIGIPKELLE